MVSALNVASAGIGALNSQVKKGQSNSLYSSPIQEPYGDFGVQIPDQVDPRDCSRYPNSPYCGGSGLSPLPIGYETQVRTTENEICLEVTPVVLFVTGAPAYFCHKSSAPRVGKPANDVVKPLPPKPPLAKLPSVCTAVIEVSAYRLVTNSYVRSDPVIGDIFRGRAERFSGRFGEDSITQTLDLAGFELKESLPLTGNFGSTWTAIYLRYESYFQVYGYMGGAVPVYQLEIYTAITFEDSNFSALDAKLELLYSSYPMPFVIVEISPICPFPTQSFRPQPKPVPPQSKGKGESPDMACCEETNDLLRRVLTLVGGSKLPKIYSTGGVGQNKLIANLPDLIELFGKEAIETSGAKDYPITLPASLVDNTTDTTKVQSTSEFLLWIVQQLDALIGEFPLKVKIKDINPLQQGDQEQIIEIPNLAEAMAEMYGLNVRSTINSEMLLNFLTRLSTEIIATKNLSVTTQDYVKANASFLGYRGEVVKRKIHSSIDLTGTPDDIATILREVDTEVSGWRESDKENVVSYLQKLMFSAGIIKAVFFRGKKDKSVFQKEIESLLGTQESKEADATWERFLSLMNNEQSVFNRDQPTEVRIDEIKISEDYRGKQL